jgi:transcriptional regulator with XRE-family HTH domain
MGEVQPVKDALRRRGYTVAGLARRLGIPQQHLGRVLNGDVTPSHEVRVALCSLLDQPVTNLFTARALTTAYRGGPGRPALRSGREARDPARSS